MINDIRIIKIGVAEASVLTIISIETFCIAFAESNSQENMDLYLADNMTEEQLTKELNDSDNLFYFAYVNGEATGYCKLRKNIPPPELATPNAIELERLYVLSKYQNNKIGAVLLQHCCDHAVQNGYETLWLGVWEHNVKAISFYKRWGFELFGSHVFMLGNDVQRDLLMKKDLNK